MASLLDFLGMGANALVGQRVAKQKGEAERAAMERQTLLETLDREEKARTAEMNRRLNEAQIRNLDSLAKERNRPATPAPQKPIYDSSRGGFIDPESGSFRPVQGLPQASRAPRTEIKDGQIIDLDTGTARPIQGYTPPQPTARQSLPTEGERKAAAFYASGKQGYDTLERLLDGDDPTTPQVEVNRGREVPGFWAQAAQRVGLGAGNVLTSDQLRQMRQAGLMLSDAWLRYTSGAAVPEQEIERFAESFIPLAGDDQQTLEQKRRARATIIEALRKGAGRALDPNTPAGTQPSITERYQLEMPE